jgi:SsrA-binding protein
LTERHPSLWPGATIIDRRHSPERDDRHIDDLHGRPTEGMVGVAMATAKKKNLSGDHVVSKNRRASFDYELGEKLEAGLVLIGSEVRALRDRSADLSDTWVDIDSHGEAWLKGMRIPPLMHAAFAHNEKRDRKLLLHEREIEHLKRKIEADGMTIVATECRIKNGRVKVEIALAKGRKTHDKRQALREKVANNEARSAIHRALKSS